MQVRQNEERKLNPESKNQVCSNTEVNIQITYRTKKGKTLRSTNGKAVPIQSRSRHFPTEKQMQWSFSRGNRKQALQIIFF